MSDAEISINAARVHAVHHGGSGTGRCMWRRLGSEAACGDVAPAKMFFCDVHEKGIATSDNPYIRAAWDGLQHDVAEAVKTAEKP
jgi:hypothetical protein